MLTSIVRACCTQLLRRECVLLPCLAATPILNSLLPTGSIQLRHSDTYRSFGEKAGRPTTFKSEAEEKLFFEKLRETQRRPSATKVARLIWFLGSDRTDLNEDENFVSLCDLASTIAGYFNAHEIEMLFRVCLKKMDRPHVALLQNLADVLMESGDMSSFSTELLTHIIDHINRKQRAVHKASQHEIGHAVLFPSQQEFVQFLLGAIVCDERLQYIAADDAGRAFCTVVLLKIGDGTEMTQLRDKIMERSVRGQLSSKRMAHIAYAASMMDEPDVLVVKTMAEQYIKTDLREDENEHLGMILYSLNKFLSPGEVPSSIAAACDRIQSKHLRNLEDREIACFFYSLGKLSIRSDEALRLLSAEIKQPRRLRNFNGQQILSILQAIMLLNYTEDRQLLVSLSREIMVGRDLKTGSARISQFSTIGICGILNVLSRLGMYQTWVIKILLSELQRPDRRESMTPTVVALMFYSMAVTKLADEATLSFLRCLVKYSVPFSTFNEKELAMTLCALAKLPRRLSIVLFSDGSLELMRRDLDKFTTPQMAGIITATAMLKYFRHVAPPMREYLRVVSTPERLEGMSERTLGEIIYAISRYRGPISTTTEMAAPFIKEAAQQARIKRMDNQALSNILLAMGKMKYGNEDHARSLVWELLQPYRSDALSQKGFIQLTHTVVALSKMKVRNCHPILDTVSNILLQKGIQTVPPVGLCFLVTHMATLGYKNSTIYDALVAQTLKQDRMGNLYPQHIPQMVEAIGTLGLGRTLADLVIHGLQSVQDVKRFDLRDLERIRTGLTSIKSNRWKTLVERINGAIINRNRTVV